MPNSHSTFAPLALAVASVLAMATSATTQVRVLLTADERNPYDAPVLVHDDARSRLILALQSGRVTEWDGANWAIALPSLPGPARAGAYDPTRRQTFFSCDVGGVMHLVEYDGVTARDRGPIPIVALALTVDVARGRVIVLGGANLTQVEVDEWDGAGWTHPAPAMVPSALGIQCAAYDENRNVTVVMLRNSVSPGVLYDTWEWDGANWILRLAGGGSLGRFAYDPTRRQLVTAESGPRAWNGAQWISITVPAPTDIAVGLATDRVHGFVWRIGSAVGGLGLMRLDAVGWSSVARRMHAGPGAGNARVVFHEGRAQLLAFDGGGQVSRTLVWDGFHWSEPTLPAVPSPRSAFSMVYDSSRANVVLFGGADSMTGRPLGDTWTWNGVWQQVATSGPPAGSALIADDRGRGRVVLLGWGQPDRWEWDGTTWQQTGAVPPAIGGTPAFGYDELRQRLVLDTGFGVQEEIGGQWRISASSSSGSPFPGLVWNVARQRLQRSTNSGWIEEYDGTTWQTGGIASGELAYDRTRNVMLGYGGQQLWQWTGAPPASFDIGRGCGSASTLVPFGLPRIGNVGFHVDLRATGGRQFAGLVLGLAPGNLSLGGGCSYYVQQELTSLVALTNDAGFLHQQLPVPAQTAFLGVAVTLQGGVLDPQSAIGVALSPGLRLVLGD